jgi:hypothetical protein
MLDNHFIVKKLVIALDEIYCMLYTLIAEKPDFKRITPYQVLETIHAREIVLNEEVLHVYEMKSMIRIVFVLSLSTLYKTIICGWDETMYHVICILSCFMCIMIVCSIYIFLMLFSDLCYIHGARTTNLYAQEHVPTHTIGALI